MVMKVMGMRSIFDATFSAALRKAWPLHPDTVVEGLGNNCFLVEFKEQADLLKVKARGTWMCQKDMVVTRLAVGPADLHDPLVHEFECWVEIHGIIPELLDREGIQKVMKGVGVPVSDFKSFYYGGNRVYKQRLIINMKEPLKPKLPVRYPQLGRKWVHVVYESIANICMFCARIGHDHTTCPAKLRLKQMKQEGQHEEELGAKPIPETVVGKWINDRAYVPRGGSTIHITDEYKGNTQSASVQEECATSNLDMGAQREKSLKRPIDLNTAAVRMITMGHNGKEGERVQGDNMHLNFKRAKEANPNSPSRFTQ